MLYLCRMAACIVALAWAAPACAWQASVPPFASHVVDTIGMLKPDEAAELARMLASYQAATGGQIAVLIVQSTAPETIDQFAIRVVDDWKPGRKGVDDGVLILIARDNPPALRRMRIEAGRGVQGDLTDARSNRILQEVVAPSFRRQDWRGGLEKGIDAIVAVLHPALVRTGAVYTPPVRQDVAAASGNAFNPGLLIVFLLIGFFPLCVGLAISALLTKGGRARFSEGKFPEGWLLLVVYVFLNSSRKDEGSGGGNGTRSTRTKTGKGTFDGGGASGNW